MAGKRVHDASVLSSRPAKPVTTNLQQGRRRWLESWPWPSARAGCLVALAVALALASCYRQRISYETLVNLVAKNECARAEAVTAPMLVVVRDGDSTRYIRYPDARRGWLTDTSLVQFGTLTTSFFVPAFVAELGRRGLGLDSVALVAGTRAVAGGRPISYGDLLFHRAGLPPYRASAETPAAQQLDDMIGALQRQAPTAADTDFHFDHWHYALAVWSLEQRGGGAGDDGYRSQPLRYVDRADSTLVAALAPSEAPSSPQRTRQATELFVLSTGGVGDAHTLSRLMDSMATVDWARLPAKPTTDSRPHVSITLGFYRQQVSSGQYVLTNAGRTRRHGAAIAYNPFTDTGVAVLIADSKPADCLALDILRNINHDWKRQPDDRQTPTDHE